MAQSSHSALYGEPTSGIAAVESALVDVSDSTLHPRTRTAELAVGKTRQHQFALERPAFLGATRRPRGVSLAVRISMPTLLFLAWWLGSTFDYIPSAVLASPKDVVLAFLELQQTGQLREFLLASVCRASLGVSIGVSLGLVLGAISG